MKRSLKYLSAIIICFLLSSCTKTPEFVNNNSSLESVASVQTVTSADSVSHLETESSSEIETPPKTEESKDNSVSSKPKISNKTDSKKPPITSEPTLTDNYVIDLSVLSKLSLTNSKNDRILKDNASGSFAYILNSSLVNWIYHNNKIYAVAKESNTLHIINTLNNEDIKSQSLPDAPGEIKIYNNIIYISFPELNCIKTYNTNSFSPITSIDGLERVLNFCIDNNIIYFSQSGYSSASIFKYNTETKEKTEIRYDKLTEFHNPALALNKNAGILYIGENGVTSPTLYAYNLKTSLISMEGKGDAITSNSRGNVFCQNGYIYWGDGEYKENSLIFNQKTKLTNPYNMSWVSLAPLTNGMEFVNSKYVCTNNAVYDIKTKEIICNFANVVKGFKGKIIISDSEQMYLYFDTYKGINKNMILVIPLKRIKKPIGWELDNQLCKQIIED